MPKVPRLVDSKGKEIPADLLTRGNLWADRISRANRHYGNWSRKYKTETLESYYYGHQWGALEDDDYQAYTHNEFFVAIDIKQPNLLFKRPSFSIKPLPSRQDFNPERSFQRAQLREDTVNTLFAGNKSFSKETELGILDAFFRFGMVEVGYSANWVDNPEANKPITADHFDPEAEEGEVIREPEKIPVDEQLYVKRIPAKTFRVGGTDNPHLNRCSWVGYYAWEKVSDLLANPKLKIKEQSLGNSNAVTDDNYDDYFQEEELYGNELRLNGMCKIWHIWDLIDKRKIIVVDGTTEIIFEARFKRLPLIPLMFRPRLESFYPLPLTYNWLSAQDEINENRESARAHRRAFQRKFIANKSAFTNEELQKLRLGVDGTIAFTEMTDITRAIVPMPNADLGASHVQSINLSMADFDNIAGISAEQRGNTGAQSNRTTATQAKLADARSGIRETRDQAIIAEWLCAIGREVLLQAKEKLSSDFWIRVNLDTNDDLGLIEAQNLEESWQLINSDEFGDDDFDVRIDINTLSPLGNNNAKNSLVEFLALLDQYKVMSLDPTLVRELAYRVGYENEKVIAKLQKLTTLAALGLEKQLEAQLGEQPGGNQNNIAQRDAANATPNDIGQIQQQVNNQSVQ